MKTIKEMIEENKNNKTIQKVKQQVSELHDLLILEDKAHDNLRNVKYEERNDELFDSISEIEDKILTTIFEMILNLQMQKYNYKLGLLYCIQSTIKEFYEKKSEGEDFDFKGILTFRIFKFACC